MNVAMVYDVVPYKMPNRNTNIPVTTQKYPKQYNLKKKILDTHGYTSC